MSEQPWTVTFEAIFGHN